MKLNNLLIGSEKPKELAAFYEKALGVKPTMDMGGYIGFDFNGIWFTIGPHDKVHGKSKEPERVLFGFEVNDVLAEFDRIRATGAKVIAEPYDPMGGDKPGIATFEDTDGNYFQLMIPWTEDDIKQ
jgi:predicted enzyme related to lactoylglutathione lyase